MTPAAVVVPDDPSAPRLDPSLPMGAADVSSESPIERAKAAGRLTLTGRASPGDDGIVKLVVKVRIPGTDSALLDALDLQALTPEQRARVFADLVYRLGAALDAKHSPPGILTAEGEADIKADQITEPAP